MMISTARFGMGAGLASLAFVVGTVAHAREKTPIPSFSGERVIAVGVPDRYGSLNDQIARLEKASPQSYYVVVVKSSGAGAGATREYADDLFETWRNAGPKRGRTFDPERSVIIVVALENRQVAVKPGATLRETFDLHADRVERDLIPAFVKLAREDRYLEAIATLLTRTNDWIAARDRQTPYAEAAVPASKPAAGDPGAVATASTDRPPAHDRSVVVVEPTPPTPVPSGWRPVILVSVAVAVIAAAFVFWIWRLFRRARGRLADRIKEIKSKAVDVMDRLDGLKERLKLMPTSTEFPEPMTGETRAIYAGVTDKLSKLWDGWLEIMEVLDKAQKLAARSGSPLSRATLAEAEELITRQGSFADIERQAQAIAADVDRLEHGHPLGRTLIDSVTAALRKIDAGLGEVKTLGWPPAPYEDERHAITTGVAQASAALAADPLGAVTALEPLQARSGALLGRIERVVALSGDAQKVKASLGTIERQVAGHRAQGLKLNEAGGDPDPLLGQGTEAHAGAMAALEAGDPDGAARQLDLARSRAQEAQAVIDKVQKARAFCERDLPARVRETERLRTALAQAESYQAELERDFARSSWQAVARNLDQARALLAAFDRQAEQAAAAGTTTRQDYLKAAALVEEMARQQQIVLRLMSGLGEQLNSLVNVRDECRKLNESLAARERQAERLVRQNDAIVGDVARQSFEAALRAKADLTARSGQPTPDWPALRQGLKEVIEDLAIAQAQAEDDLRNHQALTGEFEEVRNRARRVHDFLGSHQEDRPAANQRYQSAIRALDRVERALAEPRGQSAALLEQIKGADADLSRAEELAREDVLLATQAQSEIDLAQRAISQARDDDTMGIAVDTSLAESQWMQAQEQLQTQNYEQSIRLAGAAMQSARQLYADAMQKAQMRQMAMAAEQRRQDARMSAPAWNGVSIGAVAATAAAAVILDRVVSAASASAPAEGPTPSDTGAGSWSSDTGQGSW